MEMNNYNNEEKKSKLLNDLKTLPKIKAPDNFEFNLMTRIQNKNFGEVKSERAQFNIYKFLAPSAVIVTVFILFFLFYSPGLRQNENPLMSEPPALVSDSQSNISNTGKELAQNKQVNSKNNSLTSKTIEPKMGASNFAARIQPNDVVTKGLGNYPINNKRSVALDEFISGESEQGSTIERGSVVNSGEKAPDFDGFFIRQKPDKTTLAKYRALLDSVKKAQVRADSVKKAGK